MDKRFMDVLYDPQTSGGLLISVAEKDAPALEKALNGAIPCAAVVGGATERDKAPSSLNKTYKNGYLRLIHSV